MLSMLVIACGAFTALVLTALAATFWANPAAGMRQTTHRLDKLPLVMANRYTAFAVLGLVLTLHGDLGVLAAFFGVCAFMGFSDGVIYARAGYAHLKHTISGCLSVFAMGLAIAALALGTA